jgi:hypothetical protein
VICRRYDTVVVPFPFADIPILKRRPVVVQQRQQRNHRGNDHHGEEKQLAERCNARRSPSGKPVGSLPRQMAPDHRPE